MSARILVVEDQEDNRQILRDLLGSAGYQMTEAWDGEAGVSAAKEQHPDLILMDIQLPHMDGYEATRRIKADPELKSIPVIAVTSYALSGDDDKAHAAVTVMSRNPTARANCWRKFGTTYPNKSWSNAAPHNVRFWQILLQKSVASFFGR
jgi:two-component system cell cycle response regulator DivK